MDLRYLTGCPVGIYLQSDVKYVRRMLDRDEAAGNHDQRHRLFRLGIGTPLSPGALVHVIAERDDACWCAGIEGMPPGPYWILADDISSITAYVIRMRDTGRFAGQFPHERVKALPRVEPPSISIEDIPPAQRRPRKAAKGKALLSLSDDVPEWAA